MTTCGETNISVSNRLSPSNLSLLWTAEKQKVILPQEVVYEDVIKPQKRRRAKPEMLTERAVMLRPTARSEGEDIYVASLPVLAFDADDFIYVLKLAAQRNATIHICDKQLVFEPNKQAAKLHKASKIFSEAKAEAQAFSRGRLGGITSAAKRMAEAEQKASMITKEMWADEGYTNAELVKATGVSINTLQRIFESREKVARNKKAADKRKASAKRI